MGMSDAGRGMLQAVLLTEEQCLEDYERFHRIAGEAGRPLTYTLLATDEAPNLWQDVLRSVEKARAAGQKITPQVFNRPVGVILGLDSNMSPFDVLPYYTSRIAPLPFEQRLAELRKPEVKAALLADTPDPSVLLHSFMRDFSQLYAMANPVVQGYVDIDHALTLANDTEYGLAGYVSGADIEACRQVARGIRAGMIGLNNSFDMNVPFGGYKASGNGREWGEFGFHEYLEIKSIVGYEPAD